MKVVHNLDNKGIQKEVKGSVGFLLTNRSGGFFSHGLDSKYNGLFLRIGKKVFKIIDDIKVSGKIIEIKNNFWNVERKRVGFTEGFFMPLHTNTLVYELDKHVHIDLILDVREPYDNREWGRHYDVFVEQKKIIVKFTKKYDSGDGEPDNMEEYTIYLVIEGEEDLHYKKAGEWIKKEYGFDKKRGSIFERHVYNAMKLVSKRIVFSVSDNKEEAIENAERVLHHLDKLKDMQKRYHHLNLKAIKDKEIEFAFRCAVNSLNGLLINERKNAGMYAGLPWFFQFWGRDEAISLKAIMLENEFNVAKGVLTKESNNVTLDGRLPNGSPDGEIGSADAIGWHFKRWYDLMEILSKKRLLQKYFNKEYVKKIIDRLGVSLKLETENHTNDLLAVNSPKETWMDSIERAGANIEIQALRLNMYKIMYLLTKDRLYIGMEVELKSKVRDKFWNGKYLIDGIGYSLIRPNVFIAAYIYPELLTKKEWETCFKNILPKLWLDWGGLSTIDKTSPDFYDTHSGEDPKSYHNGDSWFWINNLAAIVLYRINKRKFKKYIDKIVKASTQDILWKGMIGQHAELSSAKKLKSEGCLSQAWSSAMYIELINELCIF